MKKDSVVLVSVVLLALAGFVLGAWGSAKSGWGDPCWVDAPMEQSHCRAQGGRSQARTMCLTCYRNYAIMFLRNEWFQKGREGHGPVQAQVQVGPGRTEMPVLQPLPSAPVEAQGGADLP